MRHWGRDKANAEFVHPQFVFARQFENLSPEMLDFIGAADEADLNQRILSRLSKQPFEVIKGSLRFRESLLQQRIVRSRWQRCEVRRQRMNSRTRTRIPLVNRIPPKRFIDR